MDYYNYQNQNVEISNNISSFPIYNVNDGSSNLHMYGSYNYQNIMPSYQNSDPRLNYAYYNFATNSNINQAIPNSQPSHEFANSQSYDLSLPKFAPTIETKTDDELWIETWLSKIGKIQINLNSTIEIPAAEHKSKKSKTAASFVHIHSAKNSLKNCLHVINRLQNMQEFLKENAATMPTTDWKKKTMEIQVIKEEFSKLFSQFENPEIVVHLRKAVEKRRKKRENQKRRRKHHAEYMNNVHEERRKAHKDIDQWLENMKEEVERVKMEENMKRDADCVLAEVTKKKSDARKSLSLISSLVKLRHVREHAAIQRGEKISLEDRAAFVKVTDHLTKIWSDALKVYAKEEHGLRVMLEQTATEDTNAARAAKERRITQEWEVAFFGPKCIPLPAFWGLTSAEKDLETFIAIRRSWDTFLTKRSDKTGTKIPVGWVTPNPQAHAGWTKYLHEM